MPWKKPKVIVCYQSRGRWTVHVEGTTDIGEWRSLVAATYETRDSANEYAKGIRAALRR